MLSWRCRRIPVQNFPVSVLRYWSWTKTRSDRKTYVMEFFLHRFYVLEAYYIDNAGFTSLCIFPILLFHLTHYGDCPFFAVDGCNVVAMSLILQHLICYCILSSISFIECFSRQCIGHQLLSYNPQTREVTWQIYCILYPFSPLLKMQHWVRTSRNTLELLHSWFWIRLWLQIQKLLVLLDVLCPYHSDSTVQEAMI